MSPTTTAHAGSLSQSNNTSASKDQNNAADTSPTSPDKVPQVFRGYVDLNYPNLLLPPNALPSVLVKVTSPRLRPSRMSYLSLKPHEEAPVFMLSVYSRFDRRELWRAEKVIMALTQLDHQFQAVGKTTARLPDRKLFSGHSPATVEARRAALNSYFGDLLDTPMNEKAALIICSFLSTDVIEPGNGETSGSAGAANGRHNGNGVFSTAPQAHYEFESLETVGRVRQAIATLPENYREVVVLCELEEMSYEEAAAALDCPLGTVRSRLHRARALLLEKLREPVMVRGLAAGN